MYEWLWDDCDYSLENYVGAPATDEDIAAAEQALGYRLPDMYKAIVREHNGGIFGPCTDNEGKKRIEDGDRIAGFLSIEEEAGPGAQPDQAKNAAPEIVDRAVEPQKDLPEFRLQDPDAAENGRKQQNAAP